jgi:hypothetical protein
MTLKEELEQILIKVYIEAISENQDWTLNQLDFEGRRMNINCANHVQSKIQNDLYERITNILEIYNYYQKSSCFPFVNFDQEV